MCLHVQVARVMYHIISNLFKTLRLLHLFTYYCIGKFEMYIPLGDISKFLEYEI